MKQYYGILWTKGGFALEQQHSSAAKTISLVMVMTLVGKVLGLYRDRLLAVHYSVGPQASAFFTASRIPRVFFDAVFASAIAACFIPVFSEYLEKKGKQEAYRFAGQFITVMALLTGGVTVLGMLFPQPMVALFADYADPDTVSLAVSLTRVMFPTVVFSGIAFSLVGVLQALDHFTAPALMSAVSNLVIILYFFGMNERFGIYGLAGAYLLGWFLQGAIQALSRSCFAKIIPKEKAGEYFGFFDIFGKGASFFGAMLMGISTQLFNTSKAGVVALALLFPLGLVLLRKSMGEGVQESGEQ